MHTNFAMWKNYLKIAIRNLYQNKTITFINITGLALGMMCVFFIIFWIKYELSYDNFHKDIDRMYRLTVTSINSNEKDLLTPSALAPTLARDIPFVDHAVRIRDMGTRNFRHADISDNEGKGIIADPTFFTFFTFPLVSGNPAYALSNAKSVVISETLAKKYFSKEDAQGNVLIINGEECLVTGVFKDIPHNAHFNFNYVRPLSSWQFEDTWSYSMLFTYFKVSNNNMEVPRIEERINDLVENYISKPEAEKIQYGIQSVRDIHLYSKIPGFNWEAGNGDINKIYLFTTIAILILILASINYINLSVVRSLKRFKEIAVKKSVGASRKQLFVQFIGEAIFLTLISMVVAGLLVEITLPYFEEFTGQTFGNHIWDWPVPLYMLLMVVVIGVITGFYPSSLITRLNIQQVFKGPVQSKKSYGLKNGLIIFQFFISSGLITCSFFVYNQVKYIQKKDLGFANKQLLEIAVGRLNKSQAEAFLAELTHVHAIKSYTRGLSFGKTASFQVSPVTAPESPVRTSLILADYDYLSSMEISLKYGRDFNKEVFSDSVSNVIINETAAQKLFQEENPIGKSIELAGLSENVMKYEVIGVVNDYHYASLRELIDPLIIKVDVNRPIRSLNLHFNSDGRQDALAGVKALWKKFEPDFPLLYSFTDKHLNALYEAELKLSQTLQLFSCIAIFIAVLGLFGLITYNTWLRRKEIGIRKICGAGFFNIIKLVVGNYTKLMLIAAIVALPLAWFAIEKWLENFAYKIHPGILTFLLPIGAILFIAYTTVISQLIKVGSINIVTVLKEE